MSSEQQLDVGNLFLLHMTNIKIYRQIDPLPAGGMRAEIAYEVRVSDCQRRCALITPLGRSRCFTCLV